MHHEIDPAPCLLHRLEHGVDGRGIGDVAVAEQQPAELLRERLDALFQRVALPGQRDLGAGGLACLGDAPGDRAIIGDTEDYSALALHQAGILRHPPHPNELCQRTCQRT
jgi:hypothetical protein